VLSTDRTYAPFKLLYLKKRFAYITNHVASPPEMMIAFLLKNAGAKGKNSFSPYDGTLVPNC